MAGRSDDEPRTDLDRLQPMLGRTRGLAYLAAAGLVVAASAHTLPEAAMTAELVVRVHGIRVVGIDLSLTSTGVAVHDGDRVTVHRIKSAGRKFTTVIDTSLRLSCIADKVAYLAAGADLAVIEAPSYGSHTGSQHERGGLWWDVVRRLVDRGVTIATVSPQGRAKYATGRGNAGKDEVLAAVVRRYPDVDVSGNDVADAVVLAAMGARHLGQPFDEVPKTHLAAMDGAKW